MSKKSKAKEAKNQVVESFEPEVLQEQLSRTQEFADKNKSTITAVLVVLAIIIGGVFAYKVYVSNQNLDGQEQLFPAVFLLEKDSVNQALNGDGNFTDGFLSIQDEFGVSPAGNLAGFYAGVAYMKEGQFDEAIEVLEDFSAGDFLVQARVYSLIGDAYFEKDDVDKAVSYYKQAAEYKPNKEFTPSYLMKLALAYQQKGDMNAAKATYKTILDDYPKSSVINDAKKFNAAISEK